MRDTKPERKIALFDVCHTLVSVTTVSDFAGNFLLSPKRNQNFKFSKWLAHFFYRVFKKLRAVSSLAYRSHYFKLLKGYSEIELSYLARVYSVHLRGKLKPHVFQVLNELKSDGYEVFLVSAGFDAYLKVFAESLGVGLICTEMEVDTRGFYTGRIKGSDCAGEEKALKARERLSDDWSEDSASFGNEFSDIPMLSLTGKKTAVDPDPDLEKYAMENGWKIMKTKE